MAVIVAVLLTFDIHSKDENGFREPTVLSGFNGGFERYADDEQAVLIRKPGSRNDNSTLKSNGAEPLASHLAMLNLHLRQWH
jgi:hypothetical protein